MKPAWEALTIDARDPSACARWWAETLGWDVVSETSAGVEVRPTQAAAVENLEARGARRVDVGQGDGDRVVLRDPEGNEFCLLEPRES